MKFEINFGSRIQIKKIYASLKEGLMNQPSSDKNDQEVNQKINKIVEEKNANNQGLLKTKFANNCKLIKEIKENLDKVLQNINRFQQQD